MKSPNQHSQTVQVSLSLYFSYSPWCEVFSHEGWGR